jgi:hypothetical protein
MAEEWRAMTPEAQAPFVAETVKHKERYEEEKKVYLEKKKVQDAIDAENAKAQAVEEAKKAKKAQQKAARDAKKVAKTEG